MCGNQKKRKHLISDLMQGKEMESKSDEGFFVKSNAEFADRQRNIFAGLAGLEAKHNEFQEKSATEIKTLEVKMQAEREVEFDFPVPSKIPARRKNNPMPSYARQPAKWTKYSLADVDADQLSEKSNAQAALSFLKLVGKNENTEIDEESDKDKKILFSKSGSLDDSRSENKVKFSSGKWRMPEYIVGQAGEKRKRGDSKLQQERKANKTCKVELSHLDDADDGDDGGEENKVESGDLKQKLSPVGKTKRFLRKVDSEDD